MWALCASQAVNPVIFCALNLKINPAWTFYPAATAMFNEDNKATDSIQTMCLFIWWVHGALPAKLKFICHKCNQGREKCGPRASKNGKRKSRDYRNHCVEPYATTRAHGQKSTCWGPPTCWGGDALQPPSHSFLHPLHEHHQVNCIVFILRYALLKHLGRKFHQAVWKRE